ncbi:MAG: hypothetical protein FRX49_01621 [Trebouxia sp. A1-2]|nr:MAG: hypothetical protein FRX49_01621 [Trebouxia sp. A1-2]
MLVRLAFACKNPASRINKPVENLELADCANDNWWEAQGTNIVPARKFRPCWDDMWAENFAQILVRDVFRLHQVPQFLKSDGGLASGMVSGSVQAM